MDGARIAGQAEAPLPLAQRARRASALSPVPARPVSATGSSGGSVRDLPTGPSAEKALLKTLTAAAVKDDIQALLIIDVDHFRALRDVHGLAAANSVLQALVQRLDEAAIAHSGRMLRLGTDEFALVAPVAACGPVVLDWARSLAASFMVSHGQATILVTVSAGLTRYSGHGKTAAEALRCARQAVTQIKRSGGAGLTTCSLKQMRDARDRADLALDLAGALNRAELVPFYQPVVSLRTNQLSGMEVLARWIHPRFGLLEPAVFIPLAEQQGLCSALTRILLQQVQADAVAWPQHWTFAFNSSPNELPALLELIESSERLSGETIHGGRLELEVTETALMQDLELARRAVTAMQPYGVKVVLDDFGSGYANFNQLCQVPFSRLKIDKSLITNMLDDTRVQACAQAIINLAHQLGMTATAEGVESAALANRLAGMGCDHAQGFYFGRPMPADDMGALTARLTDAAGEFGWAA